MRAPLPALSRRSVICLLLAGILLPACGPDGADPATGDAGGTRLVDHAMGTAEVPDDPERVVVLDTGELDNVLALGVTPVGATTSDVSTDFLGYLDGQTDDIVEVGTIAEPNLERIAGLEPDLILTSMLRHEALYDQLDAIAPTVMTETVGYPWKDNFTLHAEALGREGDAADLMADYEARADAVAAEVDPGTVISLVRFLPGQIRVYSDESFPGVAIDDIGADVPEPAAGQDTFLEVSQEQIGLADADEILVATYGPVDATDEATVTAGGLWSRLSAVRSSDVTSIDDDLITGIGIQAADLLLDSLETAVAS